MRQKYWRLIEVNLFASRGLQIVIERIVMEIELTTLGITVTPQQFGRGGRETEKPDPLAVAAFAESLSLLKQTSRHPITQSLPHDFRDSATGFKKNS